MNIKIFIEYKSAKIIVANILKNDKMKIFFMNHFLFIYFYKNCQYNLRVTECII